MGEQIKTAVSDAFTSRDHSEQVNDHFNELDDRMKSPCGVQIIDDR